MSKVCFHVLERWLCMIDTGTRLNCFILRDNFIQYVAGLRDASNAVWSMVSCSKTWSFHISRSKSLNTHGVCLSITQDVKLKESYNATFSKYKGIKNQKSTGQYRCEHCCAIYASRWADSIPIGWLQKPQINKPVCTCLMGHPNLLSTLRYRTDNNAVDININSKYCCSNYLSSSFIKQNAPVPSDNIKNKSFEDFPLPFWTNDNPLIASVPCQLPVLKYW